MHNIVISAIVGFASGVIVVLALLNGFNYENDSASQNASASETKNALVNAAPDIGEINRLKAKIAQLESLMGSSEKLVQENMDSQVLDCSAAIYSAIQATDKKNELINEFQNISSPESYDLQLQEIFAAEEHNPIWASNAESELFNAFKVDPSTQAITVSTVQCKAKTCEITVPASDTTRNEIVDAISNYSFLTLSGFKNPSTKSTLNTTNGEIKIYISNNP